MKSRFQGRFVGAGLIVMSIAFITRTADATRTQMRNRAANKIERAERIGFTCRNEIAVNELEQGQAMIIDTTIYGGNVYTILGAGDDNISDLDLEIYDERWNLIDSDKDVDPGPVITGIYTKGSSARAHLKVVAYSGSGWATAVICFKNL